MKTKIKTFAAIVVLGIFGLVNFNAAANNKSKVIDNVVSEVDKSLTIESWMLKNEYWEARSESNTVESEKALNVEAWMLADEKFLTPYIKEQKFVIEPWMTDETFFGSAESLSESVVAYKNGNYPHSHRPTHHWN